ncbi:DUF3237 domain-containing protein [Sphingopyxis sp. FD7]|jgi:hypothetical protein|uniref:DUF3237 domain-containing protein n=1 Tax=Sphingopyxis sp. FD7 TaxID=1914525 RepID=UPI000DC63D74|nr:DUF3237 domain-containing protein [Sphingopyxis sp. FD7]BBB12422.1 hypothetical protein SPYCA_1680 [Sphingopyxis sp. FD7]
MTTENRTAAPSALASRYLCTAEFEVGGGIIGIGASPFGEQRLGYISGGRFFGPQLSGMVLPGGGNWSRSGRLGESASVGTFDARAVWQTDDGALIYVSYTGRSLIPDDVRATFADPAVSDAPPSRYYLRIAPVFETANAKYGWLNGMLAVGVGERTESGVRHVIHEIL